VPRSPFRLNGRGREEFSAKRRRSANVAHELREKCVNRDPEHFTGHVLALSPHAAWRTYSLVAAFTPTTRIGRPARWQFLPQPNPCYIPPVMKLTVVIENETPREGNSTGNESHFS
jgi:hypothetical protein